MSRSDKWGLALAGMLLAAGAAGEPWNALGRAVTPEELAGWDIDVRPDGAGLPPGRGSVSAGQEIYDAQCASCHGTFGESQEYIALTGGIGSLASGSPQRTVGSKLNYATTLFDYINRAMPFNHSKSLTPDEVYAVTAYVLNLNEILPADAELDATTLPQVQMPNRDGYTLAHGMGSIDGKPDVQNTACMKDCEAKVEITSELPPDFTQQMYGDVATHFRGLYTLNSGTPTPAPQTEAAAGPAGYALTRKHGCSVCHALDKVVIGPAFQQVGARYRGTEGAAAMLAAKLRSGGSGAWGNAMMPPQAHVPEADLALIVDWLLAGAKAH